MNNLNTSSNLKLGFIGLGAIGLPIALNLIQSGYQIRYTCRNNIEEKRILLGNSKFCSSPFEVAESVDILIICVPDEAAVNSVLFDNVGALQNLKENSIVLDLSTISPIAARQIAKSLRKKRIDYIDSPITGGTEGAKNGSLTALVGGDSESINKVLPVLRVFTNEIHHFGSTGCGQEVKALNQIMIAGCYTALAEAITLGQKLKLPMDRVVKSLSNGAASSWALSNRSANMINDSYPLGFKLSLHKKDLEIAIELAGTKGIRLPVSEMVKDIEEELIQQGQSDSDISVLKRWFK